MNLLVYSLAASFSIITCDVLTHPMWIVRLRFQTEFLHSKVDNEETFNLMKAMRKIVQTVIKFIPKIGRIFYAVQRFICIFFRNFSCYNTIFFIRDY